MPRPKKPGAPEPKRRSRTGCWPCKARKIKCGEEKPTCLNCQRQKETCDYSIRLNWDGRGRKRSSAFDPDALAPRLAARSPAPSSTAPAAPPASSTPLSHHAAVEFAPPVLLPAAAPPDVRPPLQQCFQSVLSFDAPPAQPRTRPPSLSAPSPRSVRLSPTSVLPGAAEQAQTSQQQQQQRESAGARRPVLPPASCVAESPLHSPPLASPGPLVGTAYSSVAHAHAARLDPIQSHWRERNDSLRTDTTADDRPAAHDQPYAKRIKLATPSVEGDHPSSLFALTTPDAHRPPATTTTTTDTDGTVPALPRPDAKQHTRRLSHRMSVNSLLSQTLSTASAAASPDHSSPYCISESDVQRDEHTNYGYDHGHADLDLYSGAADPLGAAMLAQREEAREVPPHALRASSPESDVEADGGVRPVTVFSRGGYYAAPVPVNIPRFLMPLPASLTQSPVNLLYFHHFLNHTGKILAPHACNHNPFTTVLPKMAITNPNLLNLLLAYSASHRARLIGHPEPAHRIAHWVRYVFPSLRHALGDARARASPATLATAVMLVSLKIISPSTFEVPITWQEHLRLARELYVHYRQAHAGREPTQVSRFLSNWFGYIDVLGSLSCEEVAPPVRGVYCPSSRGGVGPEHDAADADDDDEDDPDWEIECYSGFTPRTGAAMFRLAELISQCRHERLRAASPRHASTPTATKTTPPPFEPSPALRAQAHDLLQQMAHYRAHVHKRHTSHDGESAALAASVPRAIDDAYQLACLIQLYRRVLGRASSDPAVAAASDALLATLEAVERGGSAEVCLLFPIFTVGCETADLMRRQTIIDRVRSFEHLGLKQIREARKLMQRAWEGGCEWTVLANGEFLG